MISVDDFEAAIRNPFVLDVALNAPQKRSVEFALHPPLMIVAGPGSGKTTVLVLRALKHVLVDGFLPENVLLTTFTRKAASELRDRLVGWGLSLVEHFKTVSNGSGDLATYEWLSQIDINSFQTGTLDSFLQRWLRATKPVGSPSPIMLEQFAAEFIFRRKAFRTAYSTLPNGQPNPQAAIMDAYLAKYTFAGRAPRTLGDAAKLSFSINSRLIQDLVDTAKYSYLQPGAVPAAEQIQVGLLDAYTKHLDSQLLVDFSMCAQAILTGLVNGTLYPHPSLPTIKALLVDEYQDTNPIQEAIYFELVKRSKAAFTIVGDDDQALYRFRGATVELFTNFSQRSNTALGGGLAHTEYLVTNHRSSPQIIDFFNRFVGQDPLFQSARVVGKPLIAKNNPDEGVPILGLFRETQAQIADEIATLLNSIFKGPGYQVPGTNITISRDPAYGDMGDALFLASSVREFKDDDDQTPRLVKHLRDQLEAKGTGVFNPRGQDLRDIPNVGILLGLIAECVDTGTSAELMLYIKNKTKDYISRWRAQAQIYMGLNPAPHSGGNGLKKFVTDWKKRKHSNSRMRWPDDAPLLDLIYKLIAWIPEFQNDPEHQVYLSAITRCVAQGSNYSPYGLAILNRLDPATGLPDKHTGQSANSVFMDVLVPVAEREIDVDEDLLYSLPRSRLGIMTIHQAKGLEFPVVIVDVGSDFKTAHHTQAFRRFPKTASAQADMESDLAQYTPIGSLRTNRSALDRTFDDLMRLYYVAYSRPQHLLVLVGTTGSIQYGTKINNVATMWQRDGAWSWRSANPPLKKNTPPFPEDHRLHLI